MESSKPFTVTEAQVKAALLLLMLGVIAPFAYAAINGTWGSLVAWLIYYGVLALMAACTISALHPRLRFMLTVAGLVPAAAMAILLLWFLT